MPRHKRELELLPFACLSTVVHSSFDILNKEEEATLKAVVVLALPKKPSYSTPKRLSKALYTVSKSVVQREKGKQRLSWVQGPG
jgi:hypothetical protein